MNLGSQKSASLPGRFYSGSPRSRAQTRARVFSHVPHAANPGAGLLLLYSLTVVVLAGSIVFAEPKFGVSKIERHGSEVLFCDLDGDRLKDMVLFEQTNLMIFYQDGQRGFSKEADQHYDLGNKPTLVWSARLGTGADSLLLMTSEGVAAMSFTNRGSSPVVWPIIRQPTLIPPVVDGSAAPALHFPLSAETATGWPLVLVPAEGGLQVWKHGADWERAQTLERALDTRLWASVGKHPGYIRWAGLNVGLGDLNADGREELIVRHQNRAGMEVYALYLQTTNGVFAPEPTLTYESKRDWRTWLGWVDLNRDGKVDLIKGTWLNEPWFVPGVRSGKVVLGIYPSDEHGRLPSEPQQMFRKNDWTPSVPVLDVDGDGFPDLVLGYSLFDSREGARKMMTAKQLDFSLRFHFSRGPAGFSKEPDCHRDVVIHLERHSLYLGWDRRESFERFVNLNGDFNGDGKRDLLVRDHSDQVSVYYFISRERGFSQEAALRFNCPEPIEWMETEDLNHDGASDLIVRLVKQSGFRIFLSELRGGGFAPYVESK